MEWGTWWGTSSQNGGEGHIHLSPCVGKSEYNVEPEAQREPTQVMQNTAERGERERKEAEGLLLP